MLEDLPWADLLTGLVGGLALFLLGIQQLTRALQNLSGSRLREALARLSHNPAIGATSGAVTTAIIQSSTATMVLLVGFASAGVMTLGQAVPVILGANVGTTLTMQVIAFDVTRFALVMIAVGFAISAIGRFSPVHQPARVLLALGLVFFGMHVMAQAVSPLREQGEVLSFLAGDTNIVVAMLIGATFTAIVQSSSATSGVLVVLASQGLLDLRTGIAMALGATIGTCVTPLLASMGRNRAGQRVATVQVLVNTIGVAIWLSLLPQLESLAVWMSPSSPELTGADRLAAEVPRQLANAYTSFKVINLFTFIGLTTVIVKVVTRLLPDRPDENVAGSRYLDVEALETPDIALGLARLEVVRLGEETVEMVEAAMPTVLHGNEEELTELAERDQRIDAIHEELLDYLGRLSLDGLSGGQARELFLLISVASDLEAIGDIVETNLVQLGRRRLREAVLPSSQTTQVVTELHESVTDRLRRTMTALRTEDHDLAHRVVTEKQEFTDHRREVVAHLTRRLRAEEPNRTRSYEREVEVVGQLQRIAGLTRHLARIVAGEEQLPGPEVLNS